ncbi:MAG TPA: hypothetical protein VJV74_11805 [Terriglobia bacterium]|nr:hypothetical protein [Terriglobia bacterium]
MRLTAVLAAALAVIAGAWITRRVVRARRKSPEELERLRRLDVNQSGRLTTGQVIDLVDAATDGRTSRLVVYQYELAGVTYEASQDLAALPAAWTLATQALGELVSVKYSPRTPTNSIVACENWCGLKARS